MRIRGAKTELEEAGLETEGMIESTATLRAEIEALSGVDIMEADGKTFKSTYAILDELAQKWDDLSDIQQATVTELIAGKRQGNVISSLMQNFDIARDALETSLNSSGSAMKEHEKWQQSLEARLNKLKSAWQGLSQAFLKSDFLKGALDAVIGLVDGLTKLIDTIGVLPTLITAFATAKTFTKGGGFFKVILDDATGTATGVTNVFTDAFNNVKALATSISQEAKFSFDGSDFATTLSGDESALKRYKLALDEGMSKQDAFNATMQKASPFAQNFAQTMQVTDNSVAKFSEQQRISQLAMQASDKSLANCGNLIRSYGDSMNTVGLTQQQFVQSIQETNPHLAKYLSGLNGAKGSLGGYIVSLVGAKAATIGLQIATTALNAVIGMGIGALVSFVISGITKWINAEKELAEKVEEVTSKFKEQHEELQKLKGDYDTTNESSMISKYEKLSKGVDNLGRNVSLTADEYSEYQSIVNKIAEQFPKLIYGYDSQGNALLSCKGNVEELTKAYEDLIKAQNNAIFNNVKDIGDDFANAVEENNSSGFWGTRLTEGAVKSMESNLNYVLNGGKGAIGFVDAKAVETALEDAGLIESRLIWDSNELKKAFADVAKTNPDAIRSIIETFRSGLEEDAAEMKSIAQATLSDAFDIRDSEYYDMSDTMQSVARNVVNSLDYEFYKQYKDNPLGVQTYINDMLDQLKALNAEDATNIETAFDLQTQFNGGEISYGEYVKGLEKTGKLIDGLDIDSELKSQLKLSIGLDENGLVNEYQRLRERLASDEYFDIMPEDYEPFIEGLSAEELAVVWKVIPELEESDYKENIADIKAALEKEMMLQGLTFDLNLEVEAAGLEALNTALAESVSATGLSSESISALKGRYADLEAQGFDLSVMFEETSTGIRLNREEFNKLENAYATEKLAEVDSDLEEMKIAYDDLGEAIKNCDDPIRKSELFNERQTLANRISEAATLAHQYKGLTNAYNDWLKAEESGQERDMYEKIIEGFENVDDEIKRGWVDDGTIEFLELLTGRTDLAGKSGKQLKEVYDGLDKTIGKSGYSIRDFFTVNEDGDSTNTGVYNFLETVESFEDELGDVISRDGDGNIIGFDFQVAGGDEVIAETLGISEELVQIMLRAADDAGFVVTMDGTYKQLADLQNEARAAANYLKEIGKTDVDFDFNTTSVENLKTQLEDAHKILEDKEFWNKDGTFNFNADGATQAMQVVSTLQAKLDKLTEDKYGIGLTVEDEEFEEPLENLQDYGRKVATLNQLELNPKANAKEIEELNGELNEIAEYFANLDEDKKVELGFEADDGIEDVKKKIESGEIKIPTVLDIQANMDKNIETLADLALLNSGLLSEDEEETIRKKYSIEVEADEVDTSDVEDKVETAVIDGLGNPILSREANIEIIAETFGIEDVDSLSSKLEGLDDKTIQAIAEAVGQGDVEGLDIAIADLDGNEVDAVCNALGYSDVETLKAAVANMKGNEVDAKVNTDGQAQKVWSLQSVIDGLKGKTVDIVTNIKKVFSTIVAGGKNKANQRTGADPDGSGVNGTANVNGTTGRAFKQGSWGTKNSGTALVGELGTETLVRDGRYYTIGDTGAEFIKYKKGDIIFNHRQTEELFTNGKVTSGGGRGRAFAEGTAFSSGSGGIGKVKASTKKSKSKTTTKTTTKKKKNATTTTTTTTTTSDDSNNSSDGSKASGGGDKADGSAVGADKFEETFDWIAIAIERIEREIDNLDKTVNNVYKSWGDRNTALANEIEEVNNLIDKQSQAQEAYETKAENVKLNEYAKEKGDNTDYEALIRGGNEIDFSTITDETLAEKIKEYQDWYEKALAAKDAIEDLKQTEAELYAQRFENVMSRYDGILQGFEHTETMLNEYISQTEAKGHIMSQKYYQALIDNNEDNVIPTLEKQRSEMVAKRSDYVAAMMAQGMSLDDIYNSEQYRNMSADIDGVTQDIEAATTQTIEWGNAIRDLEFERFELAHEWMSRLSSEADFLIELMSNDKLHNDDGSLTDKGMATMGLLAQNYNQAMYEADDYGAKAKEIKDRMALDPSDENYLDPLDQNNINKYNEYLELQRESILNAEDQKQAIKGLVEEGINLELDALQERIDKHNEELDSMKDLYDYQKKVKEQTEEIASLEKQMVAYSGNDSEEAKAKVQELKVSLEEAKENLQESEYDKYISDQSALLDSLYEEYELVLNERLDNVDALLNNIITEVNSSATTISNTLTTAAANVGTTLSEKMQDVWNAEGAAAKVVGTYGDKLTTTNTTLDSIKAAVNTMAGISDTEADTNIDDSNTDTSAGDPEPPPSNDNTLNQVKDKSVKEYYGVALAIWNGKYGWGNGNERKKKLKEKGFDPNRMQSIVNELGEDGYIHSGAWIGKYHGIKDLSPYHYNKFASGARRINETQFAWTQENGQEFIVRPSDGAILTPIAKGDSVLTSAASNNIWDMANSPAEFIKDNLSLGAANVPNNSNVSNNTVQHFENIIFSMPNVKNYEQLLSEMQKDKSFEKLILAMTVDRIAGGSSLAKNKSIRK